MRLTKLKIAAAIALFPPIPTWASPAPYVKPESLWPFHAFQVLMTALGFFAAYRAIRSHLPSGEKTRPESRADSPLPPAEMPETDAEQTRVQKEKMNQLLNALRVAGLIFMVGGSAAAFNTGGIDYGPAHLDEFTTRVFGGVFFLVGLSNFFILPGIVNRRGRK